MSFTQAYNTTFTVPTGQDGAATGIRWASLMSADGLVGAGGTAVTFQPEDGRIYHALQMYDRFRILRFSVSVRPMVMPPSDYSWTLYLAWDRYGPANESDPQPFEWVRDDPSVLQKTWSPGGDASPLYHRIVATSRDRFQYYSIDHTNSAVQLPAVNEQNVMVGFYPYLKWALLLPTTTSAATSIPFTIVSRVTLQFSGAATPRSATLTPILSGIFGPVNTSSGGAADNEVPDRN